MFYLHVYGSLNMLKLSSTLIIACLQITGQGANHFATSAQRITSATAGICYLVVWAQSEGSWTADGGCFAVFCVRVLHLGLSLVGASALQAAGSGNRSIQLFNQVGPRRCSRPEAPSRRSALSNACTCCIRTRAARRISIAPSVSTAPTAQCFGSFVFGCIE